MKVRLKLLSVVAVVALMGVSLVCPITGLAARDGGYDVTSSLWVKAVLQVSGAPVTLVWKAVGTDITPSGDQVISGYFYADPSIFAYGSEFNPELFIKIYIARSGWCNIAFNHVTVDDVTVSSAHQYTGAAQQTGAATLSSRLVEHEYNGVGIQNTTQANGALAPSSTDDGYTMTSGLWAKAVLQPSSGPVTLIWKEVGSDITPSGDKVVSGYFYADPADFAYGSEFNPEILVKIYIAKSGWCNIAFNHVTVDNVSISSAHNYAGSANQFGTASLTSRLVEDSYERVNINDKMALSQKSNIGNVHYTNNNNFLGFGTIAVNADAWTDYELQANIMSEDDDHIGLLFRYQDFNNYYALILDDPTNNEPTGTCLIKIVNGAVTWLTAKGRSEEYSKNKWYNLKIKAFGNNIKVYKDSQLLFNVDDDSFFSGKIGLGSDYNAGSYFDDISVVENDRILFEDSFENGMGKWQIIDEANADNAPSNWSIISMDSIEDGNNNQGNTVNLSGTWEGTHTSNAIQSHGFTNANISFYIVQSGNTANGTYESETGGAGTLSGKIAGNQLTFTANQTTIGCPGTLVGTASIQSDGTMIINYSGNDCWGSHSNGYAIVTKQ